MPQASDELRARMEVRFGDPVSDDGPTRFLQDAGYTLTKGFEWVAKDGVTDMGNMTRDEFECLLFLVHEWDFGGLITAPRDAGKPKQVTLETEFDARNPNTPQPFPVPDND